MIKTQGSDATVYTKPGMAAMRRFIENSAI